MKKVVIMFLVVMSIVSCLTNQERKERDQKVYQKKLSEVQKIKSYRILSGNHRLQRVSEHILSNGSSQVSYFLFMGGGSADMSSDRFVYVSWYSSYINAYVQTKIRWTRIKVRVSDDISEPYIRFDLIDASESELHDWDRYGRYYSVQTLINKSERREFIGDIYICCSPKDYPREILYQKEDTKQ